MRCFYHGEADGVALCKSCGRALCHECCSEVGAGSACRNRCEVDVEALNQLTSRSQQIFQRAGGAYARNGIVFIVIGGLFFGYGLFMSGDEPDIFLTVFGGMFVVFSLFQFSAARRFRRP